MAAENELFMTIVFVVKSILALGAKKSGASLSSDRFVAVSAENSINAWLRTARTAKLSLPAALTCQSRFRQPSSQPAISGVSPSDDFGAAESDLKRISQSKVGLSSGTRRNSSYLSSSLA